jgi:hypothetical protein
MENLKKKILALRALAGSSNPHEASLAALRAQELAERYGITENDLAPHNWAELSKQERANLMEKLVAEIERSLAKRAKVPYAKDVKPLTNEERDLLTTMEGHTISLNQMRREIHVQMHIMGGFSAKGLADAVIARLVLTNKLDQKRCRCIVAGIVGSIHRACGIRKHPRHAIY